MRRAVRMLELSVAVLLVAAASGCVAIGSTQKASTLGKGGWQLGIEPGIYGASVSAGGTTQTAVLPTFNAAVRFGVADTVDIGLRAGSTLLEGMAKIMFTDPRNELLALSLAPSVGGIFIGGATGGGSAGVGYLNLQIPFLVGLKLGTPGSELVIGPRMLNTLIFAGASGGGSGSSATVYAMSLGGSLGYFLQLGERFGLMPEFSIMVPAVGAASAGGSTASGGLGQGVIFSVTIGVEFGSALRSSVPEPPPPPPPSAPPPPPPPSM